MNAARARAYLERYARRAGVESIPSEGRVEIAFPSTYSLTRDPDAALLVVSRILGHTLGGASEIYLEQEPCEHVDLCAESLHSALAYFVRLCGTKIDGRYPAAEEARKRVAAFGVPGVLDGFERVPPPDYFLLPLEQIDRTSISAGTATDDEEVSGRFLKKLRRRLGGNVLKPQIAELLGQFISEAVGNAMTHGGDEWWVAGYYRRLSSEGTGYCYVTVFNFGDTIAQTLREQLPAGSSHRKHLLRLEQYHREHGLFNETWTREGFWTVAALQPGVSRSGDIAKSGHGTDDMIRFIHVIGDGMLNEERPVLSVLSGSTQILIDGTYPVARQASREIGVYTAFNPANDFLQAPDPRYVRTLEQFFPGTSVSVGFHLDTRHLEKREGEYLP